MASICNRFITRTALQSLKSAIKSQPKLRQSSPSTTQTSFATRIPSELGCVQSLLPLHSAVAAARMTSRLSSNSRSCRSLLQGSLCCTSPGL
ncbi:hypothetical protein GIB67_039251 [Kingdonia uniflora]|uniref:Uncharacterized protein n=1 Tax=Kingdonia uniflora TaxID=39325 RepID=A0A7J7MM97_9MAGN|nr:hypothetical protein GIB67_039251 [Kingdonia uniflora]